MKPEPGKQQQPAAPPEDGAGERRPETDGAPATEVGGRNGPEPTRYGDWEVGGICTDF